MSARRIGRPPVVLLTLAATAVLAGCGYLVVLNDPLTASEHNDLGVAYESTGQLDLAAQEYRRSLKRDPHQARARVNLGNVEAAKGRWRRAETCYRRALRDSSSDYDAMNNLAVALLRRGRNLQEARRLAERAAASGGERDSVYQATLAEVNASGR